MQRYIVSLFIFMFAFLALLSFPSESSANKARGEITDGNATGSSYNPKSVQSSIKTSWERWNSNDQKKFIEGGKRNKFTPSNGKHLVFDVYEHKGWNISGNNLTFEGWSALIGRYHHDRYNQATYIGAVNVNNEKERKIFKAEMLLNTHAATKARGSNSDLYLDGATNGWCPESKSSVNHEQSECNMEYKHVGFKAHLPLNELFPSTKENKEWKLYIIKNINGHLVYDQLVLSFNTNSKSWNDGTLSLESKVDNKRGHSLLALGSRTYKRLKPGTRELDNSRDLFFRKGNLYKIHSNRMVSNSVTPWYELIVPEDNNAKRWTISAYLRANGVIASLSYDRNYYDIGIKHIDELSGEVLLEEKPKSYKRGTRTFNSKSRGHFKTPEGYEYVPINESQSVKVNKDRTITFNYKASLPNPSRTVEQDGGKNTHGKAIGEAEWKLAKEDKPEEIPDPNSADFEWKNVTGGVEITKYIGNNQNVNIPDKLGGKNVVSIGKESFADKGLTSVTLPDTVIRINDGAFRMNSLGAISIPDNVTTIGNEAFASNRITGVSLADTVKTVGTRAFFGNSITDLTLGESIETIGELAFANNRISVFNASHSPNLKYIENEAFLNNEVSNVLFNEGLIRIGESAFLGNVLTNVSLPSTIDEVGRHTFASNFIESAIVHNSHTRFSKEIFASNQDDPSALTIFGYVPSTAKTYADENNHTFRDLYDEYVYINVTGGVEIIKYNGNDYDLDIPAQLGGKNVVSIGADAFKDKGITSIELPSTVHTIGEMAFADNELAWVDLSNVKKIKSGAFTRNEIKNVTFNNQLEELSEFAFRSNKLTSVTIPDGITVIERYTFDENELTSINLHDNITEIRERAFADNELKTVNLPSKLKVVGELAFWNNELTSVTLNTLLEKIEARAFDSNNLAEIVIENDELEIGDQAFSGNKENVEDFTIRGVCESTASEYAENYGHTFTDLDGNSCDVYLATDDDFDWEVVNGNEVKITNYKGNARDVVIPNEIDGKKVTIIGLGAFFDKGLSGIVLNEGLKEIEHTDLPPLGSAFFGNDLGEVVLPESLDYLGFSSFFSSNITKLVVKNPNMEFGDYGMDRDDFNREETLLYAHDELNNADIVIQGYISSTAEEYAQKFGHPFEVTTNGSAFNDTTSNSGLLATERVDLRSPSPLKWLSDFFSATEVSAKTKLDESMTHLINNFMMTGNHSGIRNVKHTIKISNHTETDTKPFAIVINPEETKDKDMEYDYEYEYTNHIKRTYTCTDKKGSDCFKWKLDKDEPAWEAPYAKRFNLSDTSGEFERYATSRLGRIDSANARIYNSLNDTTGTQASNSRINNTYYIKEKAVRGNEARYLISTNSNGTSEAIGWVNELDMTTYTHYKMNSNQKKFELTGAGKAYSTVWGASEQEVTDLRNHKDKMFNVNLTETVGDNVWYRGTFSGVSGNVWVEQNHTTSNEIVTINATEETKLNNVNNNNAKYTLAMDHKHNDTVIVDKSSNGKIESLIGRERIHTERNVTENTYGETIEVDRKDTKLKTQTSKEVKNTFKYKSDYGNDLSVVDGDKYYYPYDIDKSVRHKYENGTGHNYGEYAIPLRVSDEKKDEVEFKSADNFFLTKQTGFLFSLPHNEVSTLVINQTAKEEFEEFTGNEYSDTVISDPFDASKHYVNIDLAGEQESNVKYNDNIVIGKLGLNDITVHLLQGLEFEHYLIGHFKDDPIFVEQRTSIIPSKKISYPNSYTLTTEEIRKLKEIERNRSTKKLHGFKPLDSKEIREKVNHVVPLD